MISISALVWVIVYLIVIGVICWLLHWLIGYCGIPEPFNKIARIIIAVFGVLVVIGLLLSLINDRPLFRP